MDVMHARCCGIDIHKESVVGCLRLQEGRRIKLEVRQHGTTTTELLLRVPKILTISFPEILATCR